MENRAAVIKAVVLAAGRGTRMGDLTRTLPKPLVPVSGVPAIMRVLAGIKAAGVSNAVVVTGYLGKQVEEALGRGGVSGLNLEFVEQSEQLGTGHALALAEAKIGRSPVLLAFADIMTSESNFKAMVREHQAHNSDVTAAVRTVDDPWRAAAVYTDTAGNIQQIIEKPAIGTSTTRQAHAGLYCFSNKIFQYLDNLKLSPRGELEVTDAVAAMVADGLKCRICNLEGYWKDLATPDDVAEAELLIREEAMKKRRIRP